MGQYGRVATLAVNIYRQGNTTPAQAWQQALRNLNINNKFCPRTAFLSLSENGNIIGIPRGNYLIRRNPPNKIRAINLRNMIFNYNPPQLPMANRQNVWLQLTNNQSSKDQGVIDVVYTLFCDNLLQ